MKDINWKKLWEKRSCYIIVILAYIIIETLLAAGQISSSLKGMLVPICTYIVMAISLNLTVGIMGELSLGHAGFMSVGAFMGVASSFILADKVPNTALRLALSMGIGAIFAGIVGFLIGIPVLRLKGDYLAIVTLAFGEIIKSIMNNLYLGWDKYGLHVALLSDKAMKMEPDALKIIQGPMGIGKIQKIATFTAGIILILISLVIIFNLMHSRYGRAIMAIRDNRIAAESIGINVTYFKMIAFITSAAIAGAAGALFAQNYSTIVANKFDFSTSILILVFVVLGGQGNMMGSIISAALLTILPEVLRSFATYRMLIYAIILILMMLISNNPDIQNFINDTKRKMKKSQKKGAN